MHVGKGQLPYASLIFQDHGHAQELSPIIAHNCAYFAATGRQMASLAEGAGNEGWCKRKALEDALHLVNWLRGWTGFAELQ
jgi:hypothetical protein